MLLALALGPTACVGADLTASSLEIGADVGGAFAPLADGDTLAIERGYQGGVHIALAARADVRDELVRIDVDLLDATTMQRIAASRFPVRMADGEVAGLVVALPSVEAVAGRDVLISATLAGARDERVVTCDPP